MAAAARKPDWVNLTSHLSAAKGANALANMGSKNAVNSGARETEYELQHRNSVAITA
jgi:hypothetical protein